MEGNIEDLMYGTSQVIEVPIVVETSVSTSSSSSSANVSTITTPSSVNTACTPSLSLTVGTNSNKENRSTTHLMTSSKKCVCRGSKYNEYYYYNLIHAVSFVILSLTSLYHILITLSSGISFIIPFDIIRKRLQFN